MKLCPERDDKSQCVLDAATEVFLIHGFTAASTDMIQQKAGVSKATVYSRYPNKEALFAAVIESACQRLMEGIESATPQAIPLYEALAQIGRQYLAMLLSIEGLALFRLVVAEAVRFPHLAEQFYLAGPKRVVEVLEAQLLQAMTEGEINLRETSVHQAVTMFLSQLRGELQLYALTHPQAEISHEMISTQILLARELFWHYWGTKPVSPSSS